MPASSILIFGLGITGQAALQYCLHHAIPVIAYDDAEKPALAHNHAVSFYYKEFPEHLIPTLSRVIFSPGISPKHPLLQKLKAQHIPIMSDIDYFAKRCPGKIIGITGSNGKSTVTALTTHLLNHMGFRAVSCGNFGYPVMQLLDEQPYDYYVVELSSYQLEWTSHLNAEVGCFLNLTPNHLDRYQNIENYQRAKEHLLTQCNRYIIHSSIQPHTPWPEKTLLFSEEPESEAHFHLRIIERHVKFYSGPYCIWTFPKAGLLGSHHYANMLAALGIIQELGLSPQTAAPYLESYQGLAHRLQLIPSTDGFIWINDSKSTTTTATIAALKTVSQEYLDSPIILMLGGVFKEFDLFALSNTLKQSPIKMLILYGRDQAIFAQAFSNFWPMHQTQTLSQAVSFAQSIAKPHDCILLSPACASLDQFPNFEVRGTHFQACILKMREFEESMT